MAWVLARTNTPLAGLLGFMLIGRIVIPGILIAISWILVASPNIGLLTDMIACPGGDFCALANARSIPIAEEITQRFAEIDELYS